MITVPAVEIELVSGLDVFQPRCQEINAYWFCFGCFWGFWWAILLYNSPVWGRRWDAVQVERRCLRETTLLDAPNIFNRTLFHTHQSVTYFFQSAPLSPVSHFSNPSQSFLISSVTGVHVLVENSALKTLKYWLLRQFPLPRNHLRTPLNVQDMI